MSDEDDAEFDIARRRLGVEGEIKNIVEFQVERELATDDGWRDVYANYKQFDAVQVQGGKFKLPFSLDENTSATNLDFVYRSLAATHLAPGRDRGVMVHGRVAKRILRYELGLFERDGRNARTSDIGARLRRPDLCRPVRVEPFRRSKSVMRDLEAGVAFTGSDVEEGFPGLRGRTALDGAFFRPDYLVNGRRRRVGVEAQWRPGPFSLKSEYIRVSDERRALSVEDTDLSPLTSNGWYVSGTWAVTGEKKAAGLDTPKQAALPRRLRRGRGGGACRAARLPQRRAPARPPSTSPRADVILGNGDHVTTFGVSWYLNRWLKVQGNVIRESIDDPAQGPLPSQGLFWSRVAPAAAEHLR